MKTNTKPTSALVLVLFLTLLSLTTLSAQPGLPGDPSQAPIDGGVLWLLVGGGAYGIAKLRGLSRNAHHKR